MIRYFQILKYQYQGPYNLTHISFGQAKLPLSLGIISSAWFDTTGDR